MNDMVTVSQYAASMGGSQVYLEAEEQQSVKDMIKCIAVASANDASVAIAEHIGGSEEGFVFTAPDFYVERLILRLKTCYGVFHPVINEI